MGPFPLWREILNIIAVLGCAAALYWAVRIYLLCRARWVVLWIAAFTLVFVSRFGVVVGCEWFIEYSRVFTAVNWIILPIGFYMLYRALKRYDLNGRDR